MNRTYVIFIDFGLVTINFIGFVIYLKYKVRVVNGRGKKYEANIKCVFE